MKKKLILVSLDALSSTEFAYVRKLPNFKKIIENGAYCSHEMSVYPTLTFPCHASIATGCVPNHHRIVNNYVFLPFEKKRRWNSYASAIKCKAIWDYANESGKKILNMSWPVSGGADITYSMPEVFPIKKREWNAGCFLQQMEAFVRYGTPVFSIPAFLSTPGLPKAWVLGKEPALDFGMIRAFLREIKKRDFDIAMLHIYGLDDAKHTYGTKDAKCRAYLRKYDEFVGDLIQYCEECKDENVTLMVTGDHSQLDASWAVYGNMLLEKEGLCRYENGLLKSYQAYLDSGDGMAYIYLADDVKDREALTAKIRGLFENNRAVKRILTGAEAGMLGCDEKAALVLEANDTYSFESEYEPEAWKDSDCILESHYKGLHGYDPEHPDYQTMFFCYGKDVAAMEILSMCITDILPTACQWLGIPIDPVDGTAQPEIWNNRDRLKVF